MNKEERKKRVESRKRFHEFILGFHKEVIDIIGLELIEHDKRELREL